MGGIDRCAPLEWFLDFLFTSGATALGMRAISLITLFTPLNTRTARSAWLREIAADRDAAGSVAGMMLVLPAEPNAAQGCL